MAISGATSRVQAERPGLRANQAMIATETRIWIARMPITAIAEVQAKTTA
ncbi:MAG: hypothetical protein U1E17_06985 [Geminicoccaceae bacterium]